MKQPKSLNRGDIIRNVNPYFGEQAYKILRTPTAGNYVKCYCASTIGKSKSDWDYQNVITFNEDEIKNYKKIELNVLLKIEWVLASIIRKVSYFFLGYN